MTAPAARIVVLIMIAPDCLQIVFRAAGLLSVPDRNVADSAY